MGILEDLVEEMGILEDPAPNEQETIQLNSAAKAKEFLNQAISTINEESTYGYPRKISDTLLSGVTYRIITGYKKTNGNFVNDVLVLRNITNDETAAVYSCQMLKKLYGGKIENLTPALLKLLSKTDIYYAGKLENGSYNFIIKM